MSEGAEEPDSGAAWWAKAKGNAERLKRYWLPGGKGGAKIRWGQKGDWRRCHRLLTPYLGSRDAKGYCNRLHRRAVGFYPGDRRNR